MADRFMHTDLTTLCIGPDSTIHQAVAQLGVGPAGIVVVVDAKGKLIGTVTDGDVRRAILSNIDLEEPITVLLISKQGTAYANPISAAIGTNADSLLKILQEHKIVHLPIVDDNEIVVGLVTMSDFVTIPSPGVHAVIMAGGSGERLLPLTEETPKPMLNVGDRPLMEFIVEQLRASDIAHVNITLHHHAEKITSHFGDGKEFGVDITYTTEDLPLGTAGGLGLMEPSKETRLVINGDILTQVDFRAMVDFHRKETADLTIAVQRSGIQVPYGVIECEGTLVRGLTEKPELSFLVNAGIYLLEPVVYPFIPSGERYDMTQLIQRLVDEGLRVIAFPISEYWIDIGQHEDYRKAQDDFRSGKVAS